MIRNNQEKFKSNNKAKEKPAVKNEYIINFCTNASSDEIDDEVVAVLESAPFAKLSYPLSTYKKLINDDVTDDRIATIGFIKKYKNEKFKIHIFPPYVDAVARMYEENDEIIVEVDVYEQKNKFMSILRLNLIPWNDEDEEEPSDEEEEAWQPKVSNMSNGEEEAETVYTTGE